MNRWKTSFVSQAPEQEILFTQIHFKECKPLSCNNREMHIIFRAFFHFRLNQTINLCARQIDVMLWNEKKTNNNNRNSPMFSIKYDTAVILWTILICTTVYKLVAIFSNFRFCFIHSTAFHFNCSNCQPFFFIPTIINKMRETILITS